MLSCAMISTTLFSQVTHIFNNSSLQWILWLCSGLHNIPHGIGQGLLLRDGGWSSCLGDIFQRSLSTLVVSVFKGGLGSSSSVQEGLGTLGAILEWYRVGGFCC